MMIRDSKGRVGVVVDEREDCIFALPLGAAATIYGVHPGVGRAGYMTATAWRKQPDGSYKGIWFDAPPNAASVKATDYGDAVDLLERCGRHLYGDRWQSELARALGVNDRRVRSWMAGDYRPPAGVWADIAKMIRERRAEGASLLQEFDGGR